jgi:hypothetical protein
VEVGLLRREGGGEERVGGWERVVAVAEEVEEGLAVGEGDGRDAAEARGLDEVGVLEVVVLHEEDGGGERVRAVVLLGGEGGGGVGREGVVGAEEDVVAGDLVLDPVLLGSACSWADPAALDIPPQLLAALGEYLSAGRGTGDGAAAPATGTPPRPRPRRRRTTSS